MFECFTTFMLGLPGTSWHQPFLCKLCRLSWPGLSSWRRMTNSIQSLLHYKYNKKGKKYFWMFYHWVILCLPWNILTATFSLRTLQAVLTGTVLLTEDDLKHPKNYCKNFNIFLNVLPLLGLPGTFWRRPFQGQLSRLSWPWPSSWRSAKSIQSLLYYKYIDENALLINIIWFT